MYVGRIAVLRFMWIGVLLAAVVPVSASAQGSNRVSLSVSAGAGKTAGDTTYDGSVVYALRLGIGVRVVSRLAFEVGFDWVGGVGQSDYACVGGQACPSHFDLAAATGTVFWDGVPGPASSRLRLGLGAGVYRVLADEVPGRNDRSATAVGIHAIGAIELHRWSHGTIDLGARGVVLPSVNSEGLWFVPLEITFRFR